MEHRKKNIYQCFGGQINQVGADFDSEECWFIYKTEMEKVGQKMFKMIETFSERMVYASKIQKYICRKNHIIRRFHIKNQNISEKMTQFNLDVVPSYFSDSFFILLFFVEHVPFNFL